MPAPIIEPPPAEVKVPVAPDGAAPSPENVVPESVSRLVKMLNFEAPSQDDPLKKEAAPKAPEADKAKPKPDGAPPAAPKAGDAPAPDAGLKLRQQKLQRPDLPLAELSKPVETPKPEAFKPDPQWESSLEENEKEMLSDARYMEERFPDRYPGMASKTAAFIKAHAEKSADPNFDDQAPEYLSWLAANQPRLTRGEIRELEATRIADKVRNDYEGKLSDVRHKLFVREAEPKIQQEGTKVFAELTWQALPDEVTAAIKKDGFEKAAGTFGLEIQTAQAVLTSAVEDIVEFKRISEKDPETGRPLQAVAEKPSDPKFAQHQRLSQMVGEINESFKKSAPAQQQVRNGKWFVTRDEWNQIKSDQRHRFWTFTNAELIDAAKSQMKTIVAQAIDQKRTYITSLGFARTAPKVDAPPPPAADPPQPMTAPRVSGAPVPDDGGVIGEIDARVKALAQRLNS